MKECRYPECTEYDKPDCTMDNHDIKAMLKRRKYNYDIQRSRAKQQEYRRRRREGLPHCDGCEECAVVLDRSGKHPQRLCIDKMRLVEYKVANCPIWCSKRKHA